MEDALSIIDNSENVFKEPDWTLDELEPPFRD